jgi:hypothetical protein
MSGDDDGRQQRAAVTQSAQQFNAIHVRHPKIGNQAAIGDLAGDGEEIGGAVVDPDRKTRAREQESQRVAHGFLVIDDVNDSVSGAQGRPLSGSAV